MVFNYQSARPFRAARFAQTISPATIRFWRILATTIAAIAIVFYLIIVVALPYLASPAQSLPPFNGSSIPSVLLGIFYFALIPALGIGFFELFFHHYYKKASQVLKPNSPIPESFNMAELFSFESAQLIMHAFSLAKRSGAPEVSIGDLTLATFASKALTPLFIRLLVNPHAIVKEIYERRVKPGRSFRAFFTKPPVLGEMAKEILGDAFEAFKTHGGESILPSDILVALAKKNNRLKIFFSKIGIKDKDIDTLSFWYESLEASAKRQHRFWTRERMLRVVPIGKTWIYGYTPLLNTLALDIGTIAQRQRISAKLVGKKKTIEEIEAVLSRAGENNVLLVGEEGIGKSTLIAGFADMVARGKTVARLNYKRVLQLDIQFLVSRFKSTVQVQGALIQILEEAQRAGNIILVIDDFHNYIQSETEGVGKINISEILTPYLTLSNFQLIATTDLGSFHKYIEGDSGLMKLFTRVNIREPSATETLRIVQTVVMEIEKKVGVFFSYQALKNAVQKSDLYIMDAPYPEKALDLLEESAASIYGRDDLLVTADDIDKVLSDKINAPVGRSDKKEKKLLLNLETVIHKRLVDQEEAVREIAQSMRRARSGIGKRKKPIGSFLFLGPTGVGKTQTAKVLAESYFGSQNRIIRFDMSEYQEVGSIERFIGSLELNEPGQFISAVRDHPFSLILLDEIEKAHSNILDLFLQVLDEGHITDIFGKRINLQQTIIIATSNAGSNEIRKMVEQSLDPADEREHLMNYLMEKNYFRPEFLNRFDAVVIYHPLSREHILKIARILLNEFAQRLKEQGYIYKPTEEVVKTIAQIGFDPEFGARPMQRAIQDTIESIVSSYVLEEKIEKGIEFVVSQKEVEDMWHTRNQ